MKNFALIMMLFMAITVSGCSNNQQMKTGNVELTVSAAASLNDALNEIKVSFEKEYPSIKILYNFGGSGVLQQQISGGAPVDLFFSAATDKYERLVSDGIIDKSKGKNIVGNGLVLIAPKDSNLQSFQDLTNVNVKKVSIGIPESVPAGKYAKETFQSMHLWNQIEKKLVLAKDVRQVLTYVESGNVDAGVVYRTDALISNKVKVVATADAMSHSAIVYPVGIIEKSEHQKEAHTFFEFLQSKQAMKIFEKYGFTNLNK